MAYRKILVGILGWILENFQVVLVKEDGMTVQDESLHR